MVLSHFDSRFDVLHLSVTCRAAQTLFLPYVLSDVVIDQWELPVVQGGDEEQLAAFCAFMLADVPHRMPLLTSLNLTKDAFKFRPSGSEFHEDKRITDYSAASQLALVIRLSTHLRQLSIFDADGVFSEVPELGDAVAELARLDDIHFPMTCDATIGVFSRMKSRPRKVECYILQWDAGLNRGDDRFLGNFATSLTTLRLHRHPEVILALAPNTVWPAVANLDLENREPFFMDNWAHFARAFPNVRRLKVFDPSYGCGPSPSVPEAAEHWRNLDFVSISSPLPVRRPIRHLHYSALPSTTTHSLPDHQYADDTQEFLRQSSPVVLSCHAQVKLVEWVAAASVPSLRVLQLQCVPAARVSCPDHMRTCSAPALHHFNSVPSHSIWRSPYRSTTRRCCGMLPPPHGTSRPFTTSAYSRSSRPCVTSTNSSMGDNRSGTSSDTNGPASCRVRSRAGPSLRWCRNTPWTPSSVRSWLLRGTECHPSSLAMGHGSRPRASRIDI
ncbi:uncharacterized protein B0H18DRAFT_462045 [Fomitopsis serialis]|uniref:uncharacterized protein n=1 Tax=Fomitopsis serialis TaxID=139415 RepID=UPI002007BF79|nr:uncharacterized protein B0H18DRAFT_462045 [Neoantrodia serialis]KAH9910477.1 hypothetical protein B0H18DRAFT_462045 [Neoantrodia serialis]